MTRDGRIRLTGRPPLPECEKRHRVSITLSWDTMKAMEPYENKYGRSAFVEQCIKEKLRRLDNLNNQHTLNRYGDDD